MNVFEDKKIKLLKEKIKVHRNDAHKKGKFSLFDAKFSMDIFSVDTNYDYLKWNYEMILDWDKMCNLPYEVGISLDKLANENVVMIHRANLELDTNRKGLICNEALHSIMNEGLKNYGHMNAMGGGAFSAIPPSLTLTMTPLTGIAGYINLLSSYHSNDAIVIAAFPKELVNIDGEIIDKSTYDKIYDLSEFPPKVRREFMVGTILKKDNCLDEFYTRDEIVNSFDNTKTENIHR